MKKVFNKVRFKVMRYLKTHSLSAPFMKLRQAAIGKSGSYYGASVLVADQQIPTHIRELQTNGFTEFAQPLAKELLDEVKMHLQNLTCHDPYRPQYHHFGIENVPAETHTAHYEREDLVKNPLILKLANDPAVLKIAQEFLGAKPTISNINIWWSFPDKKKAEEAQNFHRDVDDFRFCKLFVYLTDVTETTGPHVYVKGTSNSPKLRKIRRYADEEIEGAFGKDNIIEFVRPAGSCFMVDTYGFHKGLLPRNGKRLLLQFQYSLNPIRIESYNPVKQDIPYNSYVNRLLVKL